MFELHFYITVLIILTKDLIYQILLFDVSRVISFPDYKRKKEINQKQSFPNFELSIETENE